MQVRNGLDLDQGGGGNVDSLLLITKSTEKDLTC